MGRPLQVLFYTRDPKVQLNTLVNAVVDLGGGRLSEGYPDLKPGEGERALREHKVPASYQHPWLSMHGTRWTNLRAIIDINVFSNGLPFVHPTCVTRPTTVDD